MCYDGGGERKKESKGGGQTGGGNMFTTIQENESERQLRQKRTLILGVKSLFFPETTCKPSDPCWTFVFFMELMMRLVWIHGKSLNLWSNLLQFTYKIRIIWQFIWNQNRALTWRMCSLKQTLSLSVIPRDPAAALDAAVDYVKVQSRFSFFFFFFLF